MLRNGALAYSSPNNANDINDNSREISRLLWGVFGVVGV